MTTQTPLLPSIHALLPSSQHSLQLARLSLHALHIERVIIRDDVYLATHPVIAGQTRFLRVRAIRRSPSASSSSSFDAISSPSRHDPSASTSELDIVRQTGKGKELKKKSKRSTNAGWVYTLTYLSNPLSGREYAETRVQACISLEVMGLTKRREIDGYVKALGFRHSHTITQVGHLFHLPLAPPAYGLNLNLYLTHLLPHPTTPSPPSDGTDIPPSHQNPPENKSHGAGGGDSRRGGGGDGSAQESESGEEPYLITLLPSRPVAAVGEMGLGEVVRIMGEMTEKLTGIDWGSG